MLIIGCGDIARRALPSLVKHYRVYAAVRSDARHRELRAMGVTPLRADLDKPRTLRRLAGIGNLIEIHGDGGQGRDWTDGCVALADGDMDKVFARSRVGTPVTIVGTF